MTLLELDGLLQRFTGMLWLIPVVVLLPNIVRAAIGRSRGADALWTALWGLAASRALYYARTVFFPTLSCMPREGVWVHISASIASLIALAWALYVLTYIASRIR